MKHFIAILIVFATLVSCGGVRKKSSAPQSVEPTFYTYEVVAEYPHLRTSYTQGLQFIDGELWEGTGEYGNSRILRSDLATGKVLEAKPISDEEFGEGITLLGDKIYQLTWLNGKLHTYDRKSLTHLATHTYKGEGWGLTTDGEWLYLSDGSDKIFKVNPETLRNESYISVKRAGEAVDFLNELEWIDGKIWANIYLSDEIVVINPATGVVEAVMDFQGLLPESERDVNTDVLNGIAYDQEQRRILLTGKRWSKIYHIEVVK